VSASEHSPYRGATGHQKLFLCSRIVVISTTECSRVDKVQTVRRRLRLCWSSWSSHVAETPGSGFWLVETIQAPPLAVHVAGKAEDFDSAQARDIVRARTKTRSTTACFST